MLGVVNGDPAANDKPPVDAAYQFSVPALEVADRLTVPASHLEPGVEPVIDGVVVTDASTAVLVAVVHAPTVAST